ncbi:Pr6Pr family membrane protein [Chitinophaga sp. RCC_12]|uniref:Pr6Pr family membrane protein n=1 Tax=Chitinophaga sp. RCC_12 TaxID=3239226 RepID=UPI003523ED9A
MSLQKPISIKIFLAFLSCFAWFALIPQFFITIGSNQAPWFENFIRYFSYFTLLTNAMVAISSTVLLLASNSSWGRFFARTTTATAIAVYITIVALIYNVILRPLYQFEGLQKILNEVQHVIVPVLFVLYWCVFVNKSSLQWKDFLPWLWYPLIYVLFVLIRGSFSGFYPYPFINLNDLGFRQTLINALGMGVLFALMSLAFIGVGKLWSRKK